MGADQSSPDWLRWLWPLPGPLPMAAEALETWRAITSPVQDVFSGLADPIAAVAGAARAGVVGRAVTFRAGRNTVTMTVSDVDLRPTAIGMMVGQYEDLRLEAEQVTWGSIRLRRLSVRCRNVHVRPGAPSTLVAAPVEITAVLGQDELARMLGTRLRRVALTIGEDAIARATPAGHERWGHLELVPRLDGSTVALVPTGLVLRGHRWAIRRWRGIRLHGWHLPPDVYLSAVELGPAQLTVHAVLTQWREPLSTSLLSKLARRLRAGGDAIEVPRVEPEEPVPAGDDGPG
jgi:hypothetical protein